MSEIKVNSIKGVAASAAAISVDNTNGTCTLASGSKLNNCTTDGTTNLTIADGNLVFSTNGHGIDFSAYTNASASGATTSSELLDKYEEGSWQPKLNGNNMSVNHANYTRIGNYVHIDFDIVNSTGGFATSMTGLPYDAVEMSAFHFGWVSDTSGSTQSASNLQGGLLSGDSMSFREAGGNQATNLLNGQRVIGHASYRAS